MRKSKGSVRIIAIVLAVLMVIGFVAMIVTGLGEAAEAQSLADVRRQIDEANRNLSDLQTQSSDIEEQLDVIRGTLATLRQERGNYDAELDILQEQLELLRQQIQLKEEEIEIYQALILEKENRVILAGEREEEQVELYRERVRAMEERGSLNYIQVVLSARSFSDLLMRIQDVSDIMDHDQRLADELARLREETELYQQELEEERVVLEALLEELEVARAEMQVEEARLERIIADIQARIDAGIIEEQELDEEMERMGNQIAAQMAALGTLTAEEERLIEEARQNSGGTFGTGGGAITPRGPFIWPSATSRITSPFGPRRSPGGIGSTNHRGVDIGAPMGSNIYASADGIVTISGWGRGFGNYIVIRHNINGTTYSTLYAHNSSNSVRVGDAVIQGQVIGLVGSTGNSTGPHIHFEIHRNGVHVDPMIYFVR